MSTIVIVPVKQDSSKPLVNEKCLLEKFEGKGGWTYAQVPIVKPLSKNSFGWIKVKGFIDDFEIRKYHLMPMGQGRLFLPVKALIRKKIGKDVGDLVHVILYADNDPLEIPEELMVCLQDEPAALQFFNSLSESERKYYIDWVVSSKRVDTRITRLAQAVNKLARGLKRYDLG